MNKSFLIELPRLLFASLCVVPVAAPVAAQEGRAVDVRFRQFDRDRSGFLERGEARLARGAGYAPIFEQADANRDGRLDADEFIKAEAMHDRQVAAGWVADSVITAKVKLALLREVHAAQMSVATSRGQVQLAGVAASAGERRRAAQIATSVDGVQGVCNAIVVH